MNMRNVDSKFIFACVKETGLSVLCACDFNNMSIESLNVSKLKSGCIVLYFHELSNVFKTKK